MTVRGDPGGPCAVCGFVRQAVEPADVAPRVRAAVEGLAGVLEGDPALVATRPDPSRWSALEYGAHLRDVLLSLRERTLTASIEDHPTGAPIHRDERVDLGFYSLDDPATVAAELRGAAGLYLRTRAALPAGFSDRPLLFSPVTPVEVTVEWLGTQAVHESEHHLLDAREDLARLAP